MAVRYRGRSLSLAERDRIDDAEHLGPRIDIADAGIGQMIERQAETGAVVEPVGQLDAGTEFKLVAEVEPVALIVIPGGEAGRQNPALAEKHIDQDTAICGSFELRFWPVSFFLSRLGTTTTPKPR